MAPFPNKAAVLLTQYQIIAPAPRWAQPWLYPSYTRVNKGQEDSETDPEINRVVLFRSSLTNNFLRATDTAYVKYLSPSLPVCARALSSPTFCILNFTTTTTTTKRWCCLCCGCCGQADLQFKASSKEQALEWAGLTEEDVASDSIYYSNYKPLTKDMITRFMWTNHPYVSWGAVIGTRDPYNCIVRGVVVSAHFVPECVAID